MTDPTAGSATRGDLYGRAKAATHSYIGIQGGLCLAICRDTGDVGTAKWVARWIIDGGTVERVPIDVARAAYMQPWPIVAEGGA